MTYQAVCLFVINCIIVLYRSKGHDRTLLAHPLSSTHFNPNANIDLKRLTERSAITVTERIFFAQAGVRVNRLQAVATKPPAVYAECRL